MQLTIAIASLLIKAIATYNIIKTIAIYIGTYSYMVIDGGRGLDF